MSHKINLSLVEAVEILEHYASSDDPIIWKKTETSPSGLLNIVDGYTLVKDVRVSYYASGGRLVKNGTLNGMIHDRSRMKNLYSVDAYRDELVLLRESLLNKSMSPRDKANLQLVCYRKMPAVLDELFEARERIAELEGW